MHDNGCGLCKVIVKDISVARGGQVLLSNISFELHCGELTALIGVNGAGKTTLLKAILGEIRHEGTVVFESHDGKRLSDITVGYVPQYLDFDRYAPISVEDFLLAGRTMAPVCIHRAKNARAQVNAELEAVGAASLKNRTMGELSGGEMQRVMLAAALNPRPELLILDEPVSGVDAVGSEGFYDLISQVKKNYHIAIAMVSHDLGVVREYADNVLLLNKRVLSAGPAEEVFASDEFKSSFYSGLFAEGDRL